MFDLDPGDELSLVRETARRFAGDSLIPHQREFEQARGVPAAVRRQFDSLGLAAVDLPEAAGGAGLGALAQALVLEELGAGDAGAALALDVLGPAGPALLELGGAEAVARAVEALAGETLASELGARAVVVWDDGRYLRRDGDRVSGVIPWVAADRVDLLLVLTPSGGFTVRDGIAIAQTLRGAGLRAAGAAEVKLDAAPIATSWGEPERAARALGRARLYLAALLLGVLRAAAEFSRDYAVNRVAFGRPIAHHQALAFLIADMHSAVEGTRLLIQEAAWRADNGLDFVEAAAGAFVEAVEASMFVAPNGIQILGGSGFMQDYPVEKYMRDARALGLMLGGIDRARDDSARGLDTDPLPLFLTLSDLDRPGEAA